MSASNVIIFVVYAFSIIAINGQCKWASLNADNSTGPSLDLSCLMGNTIRLNDSGTDGKRAHSYAFTVCQDGTTCTGTQDTGSAMVSQDSEENEEFCFIVAKWRASVAPRVYTGDDAVSTGDFVFTYPTGTDCGDNPRTWVPRFTCQPGVEWDVKDDVSERGQSSCVYDAQIFTKYACTASQQSCAEDDSGLSGGWIFIIILICGLFTYFCVGYIVMALTINKQGGFKDFSNNIPNKAMWINCIPLVVAGCIVTKDFIVGLTNRGSSDKEDTLVEDSAGNEETS